MPPSVSPRPRVILRLIVIGILASLPAGYLGTGIYYNLLEVGPSHTNRIGNTVGTDFGGFYTAGVEAQGGRAVDIYDPEKFRAAHERVVGRPILYPWAYPPTMLLLVAPLGLIPLVPALWTWIGVTLTALVVAVRRLAPHPVTPLAVPLFPAVAHSFITGPTGVLTAALLTTALGTLATAPEVAGACFAVLCYKPHLALVVPACLLAGSERRALVAMAVSGAVLVALSTALFGLAPWMAFVVRAAAHLDYVVRGELPWERIPTVFVAVLHATGSKSLATGVQAVISLLTLAGCAWVWRRSDDLAWRSLALTAGVPLASPYAFDYDTAILVAPFAVLAWRMWRGGLRPGPGAALVVMWVAPLAVPLVSYWLDAQLGPLVFAGLLAYAMTMAMARPWSTPGVQST